MLEDILKDYQEKHCCVGEIRRIGLFSAMEIVKDDKGTPIVEFNNDPEGIMPKIIGMLMNKGFFTYAHENMIVVAPPLIITEEELTEAMKIMDKVLDSVDKMI